MSMLYIALIRNRSPQTNMHDFSKKKMVLLLQISQVKMSKYLDKTAAPSMIGKGKLFVGLRVAGTPSPEFVAVPIPKHACYGNAIN